MLWFCFGRDCEGGKLGRITAKGSGKMQVIRYLNGKRLRGAMPPLMLDSEGIGTLLERARRRQELPLPPAAPSAILDLEERSPGRGIL